MEKINTPLGELAESILTQICAWQRETNRMDVDLKYIRMAQNTVNVLTGVHNEIKRNLPTEHDVMIDIYNQGKACVANELPSLSGIRKDSEKWFTQTFKIYEYFTENTNSRADAWAESSG